MHVVILRASRGRTPCTLRMRGPSILGPPAINFLGQITPCTCFQLILGVFLEKWAVSPWGPWKQHSADGQSSSLLWADDDGGAATALLSLCLSVRWPGPPTIASKGNQLGKFGVSSRST